ncbi:MAG TPA: hypothetical protein VEI97_19345, partial [bacterium]|nr:hypothetical protein [bacterium]
RPVLAYGGWPGEGQYHWGVITATADAGRPCGLSPFANGQVQMADWPYRICTVKPSQTPPLPPAGACRGALERIALDWEDPVGRETGDRPEQDRWHCGAPAWAHAKARLEAEGVFCPHCNDTSGCLGRLVETQTADCAAAAAFLDHAANVMDAPALMGLAERYRGLAAEWRAMDAAAALEQRPAIGTLIDKLLELQGALVAEVSPQTVGAGSR